jgi:NADH:ubiquinone reductase (H+-translocating)
MSAPRVVVVGSGFAGFFAAQTLERELPADAADLTIISATDHLCYSPLLPEVAAGRLDPRRIAVSLHTSLRRHRILQGTVDEVDFDQQTVTVHCGLDEPMLVPWDRLVMTVGSITKTFPTPGLTEHALGLKTLVEAQYIHDHVLRQLEMAAVSSDPDERRARLTFAVVGAGYAGTETAAQLQKMTFEQVVHFPTLSKDDLTWVLLDLSEAVLPELGPRLGRSALKTIRARGMDVRLGTSVTEMSDGAVTLSDGSKLATHTVLWTVGVTPPPLVKRLALPVERGRLVVDDHLLLRPNIWAGGDAAAAKDPFNRKGGDYPPTAQHAQRQGVVLGKNVAASLGHGTPVPYRHHDLGLVADLGGTAAVARPFGIPLTGVVAKLVTKGYHLYAIPAMPNRIRVGADWVLNFFSKPVAAQLGLVSASAARLDSAEHTRDQ